VGVQITVVLERPLFRGAAPQHFALENLKITSAIALAIRHAASGDQSACSFLTQFQFIPQCHFSTLAHVI